MPEKKSDMRSFVLRIDSKTMEQIEIWAAEEFRSVNGQLQWIIADSLKKYGRQPDNNKKEKE